MRVDHERVDVATSEARGPSPSRRAAPVVNETQGAIAIVVVVVIAAICVWYDWTRAT